MNTAVHARTDGNKVESSVRKESRTVRRVVLYFPQYFNAGLFFFFVFFVRYEKPSCGTRTGTRTGVLVGAIKTRVQ